MKLIYEKCFKNYREMNANQNDTIILKCQD